VLVTSGPAEALINVFLHPGSTDQNFCPISPWRKSLLGLSPWFRADRLR
jgi:hypothetical protein